MEKSEPPKEKGEKKALSKNEDKPEISKKIQEIESKLRSVEEEVHSTEDRLMLEGLEHLSISEELNNFYSSIGKSDREKISALFSFLEKLKKEFEEKNFEKKLNYLYLKNKELEQKLNEFLTEKEKFEKAIKHIEEIKFDKENIITIKESLKDIYGKMYLLRDRIELLKTQMSQEKEVKGSQQEITPSFDLDALKEVHQKISDLARKMQEIEGRKDSEGILTEIDKKQKLFEDEMVSRFKNLEKEVEEKLEGKSKEVEALIAKANTLIENLQAIFEKSPAFLEDQAKKFGAVLKSYEAYEKHFSDEILAIKNEISDVRAEFMHFTEQLVNSRMPKIDESRIKRIEEELDRNERRLAKTIQHLMQLEKFIKDRLAEFSAVKIVD